MNGMSKLCIDCLWHSCGIHGDRCHGPHLAESIVDGRRCADLPNARLLTDERFDQGDGPCGPEGKHFVSPDKPSLLSFLLVLCVAAAILFILFVGLP